MLERSKKSYEDGMLFDYNVRDMVCGQSGEQRMYRVSERGHLRKRHLRQRCRFESKTFLGFVVLLACLILLLTFQITLIQRIPEYTNTVNSNYKKKKTLRYRKMPSGPGMLKLLVIVFAWDAHHTLLSTLDMLVTRKPTNYVMSVKNTDSTHKPMKHLKQKQILSSLLGNYFEKKSMFSKSASSLLSLYEFLEYQPQPDQTNQKLYVYPVFQNSIETYTNELVSNPSLSISEKMKYELVRLSSFQNFPKKSSVFPIRLAEVGFYYTGVNDEVSCFSCCRSYQNWQPGEIPIDVHRRISPDCSFVNGNESRNVAICHESRRNVFIETTAPPSERHSATSTSIASRTYSMRNTTDTLSSPQNINGARDKLPENRQNVSGSRSDSSSASSNATNLDISVKLDSCVSDLSQLGVNCESPKYPNYTVLSIRISSYVGWPTYKSQTPKSLSIAGLFYAGFGDCVKCFSCGGGLRNWEPLDDPWVEHARWFPRCAYVRQCKGDNFVSEIINTPQQPIKAAAARSENDREVTEAKLLSSPAALSVLDMGYSEKEVLGAIAKLTTRDDQLLRAEAILEHILDAEDANKLNNGITNESFCVSDVKNKKQGTFDEGACMSEDMRMSLMQENIQLKEQSICKVCMEESVSIVFLPCGHMATCVQCAPALRKCPICRACVKGTVRAFLS